jgi:hypothetical protein
MSEEKPDTQPPLVPDVNISAQREPSKLPQRLDRFPKDESRGGIPIFYTVRTDAEGKAFFTQVDNARREECIVNRKCGICGEPLVDDIVCVGEANEETARKLRFAEAAMHEECAMYAISACPYLRTPGYVMREKRAVPAGETIQSLAGFTVERPPKLALYFLKDYRAFKFQNGPMHMVGGRGELRKLPLEF